MNWIINFCVLGLITGSYIANREGAYPWERRLSSVLVIIMVITVFAGIFKLRSMQIKYDAGVPVKPPK
jgi:hypothetical protein